MLETKDSSERCNGDNTNVNNSRAKVFLLLGCNIGIARYYNLR